MTDFFISHNKADREWAVWIAWQLEAAGYTTVKEWDFRPGGNFVKEMEKAIQEAERTIAVLSPDYLLARFTHPEWYAAFAKDPTGEQGTLLPIRVKPCELTGLLPQIIHIDLVSQDEENAQTILLLGVKRKGIKSPIEPDYSGVPPKFPGELPQAEAIQQSQRRKYSNLLFEQTLQGGGDELFSVAFSPDDTLVAAGSNGDILLWQRKQAKRARKLKGATNYIYSVAFSHDGRFIAGGGEDKFVRVWDVQSGELRWGHAHNQAVYSVAFSPDDTQVASGGYDRLVKLWDAETGQLQRQSDSTLGPTGRVSSVAFSPDGKLLAIGRLDDTITLWDIRTRKAHILRGHTSSVETVAFSPDGMLLASGGLDKMVRVWDVGSKKPKWIGRAHEYLVRSVAFSPDGKTLASASWDKTLKLWETETGEFIRELPFAQELPWHTDWIWSVAFSPKGIVLASGGSDGQIILWSVEDDHR